eukprot:g1952.t1
MITALQDELHSLEKDVKKMREQGVTPNSLVMKKLERKNKDLADLLRERGHDTILGEEKIRKLESYIEKMESKKAKQAFALPTPVKNEDLFGTIMMGPDHMRGKYESLTGDQLWGLFFFKVLVIDSILGLRDEFRTKKMEAEEKLRVQKKRQSVIDEIDNFAPMKKISLEHETKLKQIWWEPVKIQNLKDSIWEEIGFNDMSIDTEALLGEFDADVRVAKGNGKGGRRKSKSKGRRKSNKLADRASTAFDMKRAMEVGIAYQKLKHWTTKSMRTRFGDNNAYEILLQDQEHRKGGFDSENVLVLLSLIPSSDELDRIKAKPKQKLSGPEKMGKTLVENIPSAAARLKSFQFWFEFSSEASDLERTIFQMLKCTVQLERSKAFRDTLQMLRTIGNYLNSGSDTMGRQYGFSMTSLLKFAEMRGNTRMTVLDFSIAQMHKFQTHGLELPEDLEGLAGVKGKDTAFLRDAISALNMKTRHVEKTLKACDDELSKVKDVEKRDRTSVAFRKRFEPWAREARKQVTRLQELLNINVAPRIDSIVSELMPEGTGTFVELTATLLKFVTLFKTSRKKVVPGYDPPARVLWTPGKVGMKKSTPRILLSRVVNSVRARRTSDRNLKLGTTELVPPSTLPTLAKWVTMPKHRRANNTISPEGDVPIAPPRGREVEKKHEARSVPLYRLGVKRCVTCVSLYEESYPPDVVEVKAADAMADIIAKFRKVHPRSLVANPSPRKSFAALKGKELNLTGGAFCGSPRKSKQPHTPKISALNGDTSEAALKSFALDGNDEVSSDSPLKKQRV